MKTSLASTPPSPAVHAAPASWLRELARTQPARWPLGQSVRAALTVGVPFIAGLATNHTSDCMWIAMGALMLASGERAGPYRSIFRQILISAPMGAAGFLAGYLGDMPWGVVVLAMTLASFLAGIVSSYGQAFSAGALQALLTACIAIGIPGIDSYWRCSLLLLCGAASYAALLGVEALFRGRRRRQDVLAGLVSAMAELARARAARASTAQVEALRRSVTDQLRAACEALLDTDRMHNGLSGGPVSHSAFLLAADQMFTAMLSSDSPAALEAAADRLDKLATEIASDTPPELRALSPAGEERHAAALLQGHHEASPPRAGTSADPLAPAVELLRQAYAGGATRDASDAAPPRALSARRRRLKALIDRLACGRATVMSALALALCVGLAYATHWFNDASHWYWTPLTVGLVMKPDFGSVFARAMLRCIGTAGGVLIGATALALLPKGFLLAFLTVGLAATLPWAKLRSYAVQTIALTPLVLILIDLASPGVANVDYGLQRLADTFIAAAIVLAFGYFPWRRGQQRQIKVAFVEARASIAASLRATIPAQNGKAADSAQLTETARRRRAAYGALSDLRIQLQRVMAEPPPTGREAAAWLPLVASAERICDAIAIWSSREPQPLPAADARTVARLASAISEGAGALADADLASAEPAVASLVASVSRELTHLDQLTAARRVTAQPMLEIPESGKAG